MNNFTLIFTTALLSMMFLQSSEASAQFVRLDVEEIDNGGIVPGKTFRVYAVFTNSGDILDAVYGEASAALKISSTKSFYQHPKGGPLSTDIQRYDMSVNPELAFDSWVTIGSEDNYMNALSGFIMEFGTFETEGGEISTDNGAWFVTPDKRQSMAPDSKRILLMQLTTEGKVNGLINLHGRTKAVYKDEVQIGGGEQIKAEGLRFIAE
jgi:hypothetical protein|tara:strand:- start:12788 stop:13414 length:627 start_codon:yes stop_codon:yes gene_type:complete